jgi:hypothetical protein
VKILVWDTSGLVLVWKQLQQSTFRWPPVMDGVMRLSAIPPGCIASCLGLTGWHKAKALLVYFKGGIELATEVFERYRRSQLDELCLVVVLLQSCEEFVVDLLVGIRDVFCILECDALGIAEQRAAAPCRDLSQFPGTIITFPHTEGIDVNSEGASINQRRPQIDERL